MNTLSLPFNLGNQSLNRKRSLYRVYYPSLKIIKFIAIVLIIAFASIYLFQINHIVVNLYKISQLESEVKQLSFDNQQLELSLANSGQTTNFSQLAQKFNFEKINKIYYIREDGNRIVER